MFGHTIKRQHTRIATVLVAVALLIIGSFSGAAVAKAATLEELQAMIATLMAQIVALQAASGTGGVQASSTGALHIGATITTTDVLRVRSAAGINALYIATQPVGSVGVIVEGPVVRDGYNWFKVDYATGTDGWNVGAWLRARTDAPDFKATYVGYMDGRMFITTENISRTDALANCKLSAVNNPNAVVRCTWRGTEMYISTATKTWPRIVDAMGPADASFVRATVVFGTPTTGVPAVTGPTKVGTINWGDGTAVETITALITGTQVSIERTHTYARNGSYTITATGLDGKSDTRTVRISTLPKPIATTTGLYQGYKSGRLFVETANITKAVAQTNCQTNVAANPTTIFRCVWNGKVIFATGLIYENPDIPVRVLSVTNSKNPVITGTASGTGVVGISISNGDKVYGYADILVTNGQWSHTVASDLSTGKYTMVVYVAVENLQHQVASRNFAIELSTASAATNTPDRNGFGCGRTLNAGTFANGAIGCYGMWDYGDTFGGDRFECGDLAAGKTGCVIKTKVCTSGYAKATAYYAGSDLTATKLNTVSARLNTTPEIAKNGIAGLWEYSCTPKPVITTPTASTTTPGTVLGATTNVYTEIANTLAGIQAALSSLK